MGENHELVAKTMAIIHREERAYKEAKLQETGLRVSQLRYLWTLYKEDGLAQETLSRRFLTDKANVTRHIKQLERLGMIRRECDTHDKRVQRVYLTKKGHSMRDLIEEVTNTFSDTLTEGFSEKEKKEMLRLLVQMADNARRFAERSSEE
ncbi:putative transcriptional regulator [Listeria fleischmannii 1991]|uniref:Multidrug resistance operon repressor n=2 Tax=Listeria fleischmannii TaxID=1069827 RepID=A0A2X3J8F7_9LIST|nr:MarR family transcriptional regulator [Listeria fleischmannii]EMG28734.1 putative transcriptional regulator [Listeria fleischmannii subsp. fleischmannii LU2006-1]KMT58249.1 putative transcriptional regulator [Listeria fleischmannii 1991]SQC70490.1 Multidrug resistance operon repressor [Listeria fleischmannii subsp. fleischmannii]